MHSQVLRHGTPLSTQSRSIMANYDQHLDASALLHVRRPQDPDEGYINSWNAHIRVQSGRTIHLSQEILSHF